MFTLFLLLLFPFFRPLEAIYKNVLTVSYGIESEREQEKLNLRHGSSSYYSLTLSYDCHKTYNVEANIMTIAYDDDGTHVSHYVAVFYNINELHNGGSCLMGERTFRRNGIIFKNPQLSS
jgi:hypothetical protein